MRAKEIKTEKERERESKNVNRDGASERKLETQRERLGEWGKGSKRHTNLKHKKKE